MIESFLLPVKPVTYINKKLKKVLDWQNNM